LIAAAKLPGKNPAKGAGSAEPIDITNTVFAKPGLGVEFVGAVLRLSGVGAVLEIVQKAATVGENATGGAQTVATVANDVVKGVNTPYGPAFQSTDSAAIAARAQVESGATLYRVGTSGKSQAAEAQFWALEHPNTPGFAQRYGIPVENVQNINFIEAATLNPGTTFITRPSPGVGTNVGGGIEVVVPKGGVQMKWFSSQ
jgi:LysM repeat protein